MLNERYRVYIQDIMRFCKLVVIKFDTTPDLMNELVALQYGKSHVNSDDPHTWRYYLNLAGEYHFADKQMVVTSLDTAEEITFNKEELEKHVVTKMSYCSLSSYYYDLVTRYPEQEGLIRGILYPVDIDKAINAPVGSILTYPPELIEPQETTLIDELQTWLNNYLSRWHIQPFATTDSLYAAAYQAVIHTLMPSRILNLRMRRCKTREAHTFHIRSYLASHANLDKYFDYLTLEQRLFLYRNIRYIMRNSGNQKDFEWLTHWMLSKRKLPLGEYTARQYAGYDDDFYPNFHYRKSPLNTPYNVPEKDYYTLDEIRYKERNAAPDNISYWQQYYNRIDKKFRNSGNAVMLTKNLECNVYDYTNSVPYPLPTITLNEWAYRSFKGTYKVLTTFKHPTKSTIHTVRSDVAFVYMIYQLCKMKGIVLDALPKFYCDSVLRTPRATLNEVMKISGLKQPDRKDIALWLIQNTPTEPVLYSKYHFNAFCNNLYLARLDQWFLISGTGELSERGYVANMVNRLYVDAVVDFNDVSFNPENLSMREWLGRHNLPLEDFNQQDLVTLTTALFTNATGYYVDKTKMIRYIQEAMVGVMKALTSYSVQWLSAVIDSNIRPVNWPASRIGNLQGKQHSREAFHTNITVTDAHLSSSTSTAYELDNMLHGHTTRHKTSTHINSNSVIDTRIITRQSTSTVMKSIVTSVVTPTGSWLTTPLSPEQILSLQG